MQRSLRMNELQLLALSEKALQDNGPRGYLFKRTDNGKWQMRWFVLFQNLLFYFENDNCGRPSGVIFLEGSYCDKIVQPSTGKNSSNNQVSCSLALSSSFSSFLPNGFVCSFFFSCFIVAVILNSVISLCALSLASP